MKFIMNQQIRRCRIDIRYFGILPYLTYAEENNKHVLYFGWLHIMFIFILKDGNNADY